MFALLAVLERERERLDQLRFRLVETRLLLAAGEVRYLRWAAAEVEQAWLRVDRLDVQRAVAVRRVSGIVTHRAPTLRELAQDAGVPLSGILRDHHEGLCCLVSELEVIGHRTAELARQGIAELAARSEAGGDSGIADRASQHAMRVVLPDAGALLAEGSDVAAIDREGAYQEVIIRTARLRMPSLLAFLR